MPTVFAISLGVNMMPVFWGSVQEVAKASRNLSSSILVSYVPWPGALPTSASFYRIAHPNGGSSAFASIARHRRNTTAGVTPFLKRLLGEATPHVSSIARRTGMYVHNLETA